MAVDRNRLYGELRRVIEATGAVISGHVEDKLEELVWAVVPDGEETEAEAPDWEIIVYSDGTTKRAEETG